MAFNALLRSAARLPGKLFTGLLALTIFTLIALLTTAGFLLYRSVTVETAVMTITPESFPGHPQSITFASPAGDTREGLFFPGRRFSPTIILCHGYQSHTGEILTLATALQDSQFNVFVFDFSGHGKSEGWSHLGYRESAEVLGVIRQIANRDDVDTKRFGVWGADMGAYAALSAAIEDPRIRAVVVDSPFPHPPDFLRTQLTNTGVSRLPFVRRFTEWGLTALNYSQRSRPPLSTQLDRLAGVPKFFIQSQSLPVLAEFSQELYNVAPGPKETWWSSGRYSRLPDDEKRDYESRLSSFFLMNLPLASPPPTPATPASSPPRR